MYRIDDMVPKSKDLDGLSTIVPEGTYYIQFTFDGYPRIKYWCVNCCPPAVQAYRFSQHVESALPFERNKAIEVILEDKRLEQYDNANYYLVPENEYILYRMGINNEES